MNSAVLGYQLPTFTGLVNHGWSRSMFLRDTEEHTLKDKKVDVQVRSGDYFVTLATDLDQLSSKIDNLNVRVDLENAVSDLIYLQDHYKIVRKSNT